MQCGQNRGNQSVDDFDADKGGDHTAQTVDHHVPGQHFAGRHGAVLDALHGQRNQAGNDDRIEDQCRQNGAVLGAQVHDVQDTQLGNRPP